MSLSFTFQFKIERFFKTAYVKYFNSSINNLVALFCVINQLLELSVRAMYFRHIDKK